MPTHLALDADGDLVPDEGAYRAEVEYALHEYAAACGVPDTQERHDAIAAFLTALGYASRPEMRACVLDAALRAADALRRM